MAMKTMDYLVKGQDHGQNGSQALDIYLEMRKVV